MLAGGIETRPNPLGIGSCKGKDGFQGLLDDVSMFAFQFVTCKLVEPYQILLGLMTVFPIIFFGRCRSGGLTCFGLTNVCQRCSY